MARIVTSTAQLSAILKAARKAQGRTQAHVGQRIGVSQNRISELESDAGALTVDRLLGLLRELGLELVVREPDAASAPPARPSRRKAGAADADW